MPATPAGMHAVLEQLIASGNYRHRAAVLEFPHRLRLLFPGTARYDEGGVGSPRATLQPDNIFPLLARYRHDGVSLQLNTQSGIGGIRSANFAERNPFGFSQHYNSWNEETGRNVANVVVSSTGALGVRNQQCEASLGKRCAFLTTFTTQPLSFSDHQQ